MGQIDGMNPNENVLIIAVGIAGSGKTTTLRKMFPKAVVSTDQCRYIVSGDEGNQECSAEAFRLFYHLIERRMQRGLMVVADSTGLNKDVRKKLRKLAEKYEYKVYAMVFDTPLETCIKRQEYRDRKVPIEVIERQYKMLQQAKQAIMHEGYDRIIFV